MQPLKTVANKSENNNFTSIYYIYYTSRLSQNILLPGLHMKLTVPPSQEDKKRLRSKYHFLSVIKDILQLYLNLSNL